ncbi:MAG: OmpA family protein [Muribaculaceae bacterium]|nr:OmpA family protein [Muribaculaceae bacterium]
MKKFILLAAVAATAMSVNAQQAIEATGAGDNWSIGLVGGVTTPIEDAAFIGDMRGAAGIEINKQVSPIFGFGIEGIWGVNTSSWSGVKSANVFDSHYVGAYGKFNLNNLFTGYDCKKDFFEVEAVAGAGWGREYVANGYDWNYFATKAGLNLNFNVSKKVTIAIKPSMIWNMSDARRWNSSASYDSHFATFQLLAGVSYNFGKGFVCVKPYDQAEVDALNAEINALRGQLDACNGNVDALNARNAALQAQLDECLNQPKAPAQVVVENNVRSVMFKQGSATISKDQKAVVAQIAKCLEGNDATIVVKGYASKEGGEAINEKLAGERAEAVKNMLVNEFGIDASRIDTENGGVSEKFPELAWNRVCICTISK